MKNLVKCKDTKDYFILNSNHFTFPSFTSLLFEIPTGAIADIYGRKFSVVLAYIFAGIIIILVPLSRNFYYLFFLFLMWGITDTFRTGADEAWVISNLKKNF